MGDRRSVDEGDVAANTERGMGAGDGDGIVKGWAVCHKGRRGEDAGAMKLVDGTVDARSETEVVRVEDEAGWHAWLEEYRAEGKLEMKDLGE